MHPSHLHGIECLSVLLFFVEVLLELEPIGAAAEHGIELRHELSRGPRHVAPLGRGELGTTCLDCITDW